MAMYLRRDPTIAERIVGADLIVTRTLPARGDLVIGRATIAGSA